MGKNEIVNKDSWLCYFFRCTKVDEDCGYEYVTRLTVEIDNETFYFYVLEKRYDGILTWNEEPDEHYPFIDTWDGPEIFDNRYEGFNMEKSDNFRQSAFLSLDELRDYVENKFVETYKDMQFKW